MSLENPNKNEGTQSEVIILRTQLEREGTDLEDPIEVLKVAHLLFGEGRNEDEVLDIIQAMRDQEAEAANEADKRAE